LYIDTNSVTEVLLSDGWHSVESDKAGDSTFDLDSYEFHWGEMLVHGGGRHGVCAIGFAFIEGKARIAGPLTAILAVRYRA
jgi:hypothetical protein